MRKWIALNLTRLTVLLLALALSGTAIAAPAERTVEPRKSGERLMRLKAFGDTLSLQRLFGQRFRLSLDLLDSLRTLEEPEEAAPGFGTLGIVDVPDPIVKAKRDGASSTEPGEEPSDDEKRRQAERDAITESSSTQPYQEMH